MFAPKKQNNSGHHPNTNQNEPKRVPFVLQRKGENKGILEKYKMGRQNDRFEKEADAVADQVVSTSETPSVAASPAPPIQTMTVGPNDLAQSKEDSAEVNEVQLEEEEDVQMMEETAVEQPVEAVETKAQLMEDATTVSDQQEEEEVQLMPEEENEIQTSLDSSGETEEVQLQSEMGSAPEKETDTSTSSVETAQLKSETSESGGSNVAETIQAKAITPEPPKVVAAPPVQLQSESSADEDLQRKEDEEMADDSESVQMKSKAMDSGEDVSSQIDNARGGGSPMDETVKTEMERGFGHDFSDVRIHTDSAAADMNQSLGARAFTTGNDIFFNEGEYQPETKDGKHLLAHELTHTLQQSGSGNEIQQKEEDDQTLIEEESDEIAASISITTDREIKEGDADFYAMNLTFAAAMGLDKENYRVKRSYQKFHWSNGFGARGKGETFPVSLSNEIYLSALRSAYAEEGFDTALVMYLDLFESHDKAFTADERILLRIGAKLYGRMTYLDLKYFDRWMIRLGGSQFKSANIDLSTLKLHVTHLKKFLRQKLEKINSIGELEVFTTKEDDERLNRFEYLKNRINEMPGHLLNQLLEETGLEMGNALWSIITGGSFINPVEAAQDVVKDESSRLEKINKKLRKKGFEASEVFDFIALFKEIAIGEAFRLLKENYDIMKSEHEEYTDWSGFKKLYNYLNERYTPRFRKADRLRAIGALDFIEKCKTKVPIKAGGAVIKKLYSLRNDLDKAAAYIGTMRPESLVESLALLAEEYAYAQMTPEQKLWHSLQKGFQEKPTFIIIGKKPQRPLQQYVDQVLREVVELQAANRMDAETLIHMQTEGAKDFPVLADLTFDFRRMTTYTKHSFRKTILEQLEEKMDNNLKVQKELKNDPETVWKLELLIQKVQQDLGVAPESKPGKIINDIYEDKADIEFWENIALGALGIVLGIAGFFTAGTTWASLAIVATGVTISAYVLYDEIQKYEFQKAAIDTSLDPAKELSAKNPSMLGIVLAVIGLVLDAADIFVAISKLGKVAKGSKEFIQDFIEVDGTKYLKDDLNKVQKAFDEFVTDANASSNIQKHASAIYEALGKQYMGKSLEAFTTEMSELLSSQKSFKSNLSVVFARLQIPSKYVDPFSEGIVGLGTRRMLEQSEEALKRIIRQSNGDMKYLTHFALEAAYDSNFSRAIGRMSEKMSDAGNFRDLMFHIYNSRGVKTNLNDVLDLIDDAAITSEKLTSEIIKYPGLHKVMSELNDPADIKKIWDNFWTENPPMSFSRYAETEVKLFNRIQAVNATKSKLWNNTELIKHVFQGDTRKVTGCHYLSGVDGVNIRFVNDKIPEANSLGVLKGDIEFKKPLLNSRGEVVDYRWVKKNTQGEPQTFFPANWSKEEIIHQCATALNNPKRELVPGKTRMWTAESDSGVFIKWFEDSNGNITSLFPEFN